ncbi:xaa-Arg dipeptidase-like [Amphiura filiformis]|uniref:xaa-Arg dipeptidase-like n=1 Tax=Amphiura filiformis TaxID=82378 RepID=UPI003B228C95
MDELTQISSYSTQQIDQKSQELKELSFQIWSHPETCYNETHAHEVLTSFLEKEGFVVERNFIHQTGFRATFGTNNGVNVCVICEYDALPEIGHACGHNLIAECGVAAGIAIKAALEKAPNKHGKVTILGTPAEEGGGGKLKMIEAGVFDEIHVALMAHPCPHNIPRPPLLAKQEVQITFTGKPAHAAAFPWQGVNALDAAVMCYQAISLMRQQFKPTWRVHGIFTNGGVKPSIIPDKAELQYYLRAPTVLELEELKSKFEGCVQGSALLAGCQASYKYDTGYLDLVTNKHLASLYEQHATAQGLVFTTDKSVEQNESASGDIGNVSQVIPTIQPGYSIHTSDSNHTRGFREAAGSDRAHLATLTQAKILALTALDLIFDDNDKTLQAIQEEFKATFGSR